MPRIAVTTNVFPEAILEVHVVPKEDEAIKITLKKNQIVWKKSNIVDPMIGNVVVIMSLGQDVKTRFEEETLPLCFLQEFEAMEKKKAELIEQKAREEEELAALSCRELLTKINELVASQQRTMQMAYEEGPYWARQVKEGIISSIRYYLGKATSFQECDCEDAHNLREIKSLVYGSDEEAAQTGTGEISKRMMVDHAYYVLEGLLGLTKGERPSMKIMGPDIGEQELHLEDIL